MIDSMASRYGVLPSEILERGDTFDVYVLQSATAWQDYQEQMAKAKAGKGPIPTPHIPQQQLKDMLDRVKRKKK